MLRRRKRATPPEPLYRRVFQYLWDFKTTDAGKCLLLGLMLSASMGSATLDIPLYHLVCYLAATVVVAFTMGLMLRPRVVLHGDLPQRAVAGRPFTSQFHATNRGRIPVYDLGVGLFPLPNHVRQDLVDGAVTRLAPGESAVVQLTVHPLRRGWHTLPALYPYTVFPFNVFRSAARPQPPRPLLVLPAFEPVHDVDLPIARRYQPGGISLASKVGESPEYIGSREYRPGDPVDDIDYRSWARLARPVVREFQEEYFCRIALVLDTYVPKRTRIPAEGHLELEAAVSVAAAMADALTRDEHVIDIFAAGPELHVFQAGRHSAHAENVLEILAGVNACRTDPCLDLAPALAQELASLSAAVCIFLDWNEPRRRMVREMAESGCAVKLVLVRSKPPTVPLAPEEDEEFRAIIVTPADVRSGVLERV